jgi:hypothetical protein
MRVSSRADRRGFALGWVSVFVGVLAVGATALWFVTGTTQKNIARATVAQAYLDVAASALAEIRAKLRNSAADQQPFEGKDYTRYLTTHYPPPPTRFVPTLTQQMARELYPDITVQPVTVEAVGRTSPGHLDPVVGILEFSVKVEGRVGGWTMGRELTQRVMFNVPCGIRRTAGPRGTFRTPHWGTPNVTPYAMGQAVKNL